MQKKTKNFRNNGYNMVLKKSPPLPEAQVNFRIVAYEMRYIPQKKYSIIFSTEKSSFSFSSHSPLPSTTKKPDVCSILFEIFLINRKFVKWLHMILFFFHTSPLYEYIGQILVPLTQFVHNCGLVILKRLWIMIYRNLLLNNLIFLVLQSRCP